MLAERCERGHQEVGQEAAALEIDQLIGIGEMGALIVDAAKKAKEVGVGLNAGHDLDLHNLKYFKQNIPWLDEVSIGHALISDALYLGLENTIQLYKRQLGI